MPGDENITVEYVLQCLRYEDGKLYWLRRPIEHFKSAHGMNIWNAQNAGKEAGDMKVYKSDRRWRIRINKKQYRRSRLVWSMHNGRWPVSLVDHKNHNTIDDRIDNLREATGTQNNGNRMVGSSNTSGFKGVCWDKRKGKWMAQIKIQRKCKHVGYFSSPEDAHDAYVEAASKAFGEFACSGV